ncbi:MAG: S-layer homology domain-containing protein [Oscillospiraceae bacterium]|nr:S-layer homology domain-containing protein [Oscillospiraceae bacterium]
MMEKCRSIKLFPIIIILMLITAQTASWAALPPDVAGRPYEEAVSALVDKNIITGDVDGKYYPDSFLTRAQFCTIIVKAMRAPVASLDGTVTQDARKSSFPDLSGYGWAEGYISYAVEKGVVMGYPDGTFKPGNNVSINELITMTLRAAGYTDNGLGGVWPANYVAKAAELGALKGLPVNMPTVAAKWHAAQFVYNMLSAVEKANPIEENKQLLAMPPYEPPPTPGESLTLLPDKPSSSGMSYVNNGKFDRDILTFAGKDISSNVQVLTYKLRSEYSSDMTLSAVTGDYMEGNIYKYKNVETPAWCLVENNKITKIILPHDVGFSGFAYSVINEIVKVSDGEGNAVSGYVSLAAGRSITWFVNVGYNVEDPEKADYLNGTLFELRLTNGKIRHIAAADGSFGETLARVVHEIEPKGFSEIIERSGTVLRFGDENYVEIKENATVYFYDKTEETYSVASVSDIRKLSSVRLFDVSDDKEDAADIVIIEKK